MDKNTEIRTLKSLKGDTYFNQFFTSEDIDEMCENIEKDFAIESGIEKLSAADKLEKAINKKEALQKQLNAYQEELDNKCKDIDNLARFIAIQAQEESSCTMRDKAIELMGEAEYIKYILSNGYDLLEEDRKMLIKML